MVKNPHEVSGVESEMHQPARSGGKAAPAETFDQKPRMETHPFGGEKKRRFAKKEKRHIEGVEDYKGPAGGWGALKAVARALSSEMSVSVSREMKGLLTLNQPTGFDCPGCAWPDPRHTSSFEFCENGAKAVAWEATSKRATPEFFAAHTVSELWGWPDFALESEGRLTHPLAYDATTDTYQPIAWEDAFQRIGAALRALPDPNMAEFYTSGRTSNEAAFLYQLYVREFGTNNFPDCSNMCHEATSVGLPESIGVGKGTVTLDDFDHADAIFCIGHNPGTNHPRMLGTLRDASRRGMQDRRLQPLARARPGTLPSAAEPFRDGDARLDANRVVLLPGRNRR